MDCIFTLGGTYRDNGRRYVSGEVVDNDRKFPVLYNLDTKNCIFGYQFMYSLYTDSEIASITSFIRNSIDDLLHTFSTEEYLQQAAPSG